MNVWRLKKGADRRMRMGHPWVFASELAHSAKEVTPGEVVELRDAQNHFLAFGYVHPSSQIAFRKLSGRANESDVLSVDFFKRRLLAARELRRLSGWTDWSHRWLYAEADGVPGLVADAFRVEKDKWVMSVQASTAGMEKALPNLYSAIESLSSEFGEVALLAAPSKRGQVAEGLSVVERRLVKGSVAQNADGGVAIHLVDDLKIDCDLVGGQKTGFFLDQQANARLMKRMLARFKKKDGEPFRVLDICCYVGQWAAHATQELLRLKAPVEVTLVDSSAAALRQAQSNVQALGGQAEAREGDALTLLTEMAASPLAGKFDVVICDPPAFVKKKADLESGLRAYTKLNRDAMKLARPGGVLVASSCSGLVRSSDFTQVLAEAGAKSGRMFRQVWVGGHGPDHPLRPEFPEGEYLKCSVGQIDYPF